MTINKIIILFTAILLVCCQSKKAEFTTEGANHFGEEITSNDAVTLTSLDIGDELSDTLSIKLSGTINEVCQAKGCWMTIDDEASARSVFIKFKDYAFFVPKDAGGKDAVVQGKLYSNITSVEELKHYAEDKGASADEIASITEPERELRMMADGVIIYN